MILMPWAQAGPPDMAVWFLLLFVFTGLLMAGLSIPLATRRVKPNLLYGFRTPTTLRDERIWFDINAYAGRLLLRFSLLFVLVAIAFYFPLGSDFVVYNLACAAVLIIGLVVTLILAFRYLRTLVRPSDRIAE